MGDSSSNLEVVLAPLLGITTAAFRTFFAKYFGGVDRCIAPFIPTAKGTTPSLRHFRAIMQGESRLLPLTPQLIGNNARDFVATANRIHGLGFACVNWNLGCPSPTVTRKNRGSALLGDTGRIRSFLDYAAPRITCRISIKARLGFANPEELAALIPVFNEYPLEEIIIHPRTGMQMFGGDIDLERFGACLAQSLHPVVYNGDITTVDTFHSLRRRFPQTGAWMIGRGLCADPFLAMDIKGCAVSDEERKERLKAFHDDLYHHYRNQLHGPAHVLGKMKELWPYLAKRFENEERILKKIRKITRYSEYEEYVGKLW
jgi:tRNA-dihydrouridine synthase